ncbi:MAG TPA: ATP-binding protein [Gemmatimonadales bacterium]|nr:ATP-binding protein [Gemmatimonadales bacterium]
MAFRHRIGLAALLLSVVVAEWLRHPRAALVVAAAAVAAAGAILLVRGTVYSRRRQIVAGWLLLLPILQAFYQVRLLRIESHWPEVREAIIHQDSIDLSGRLRAALERADRLARAGIAAESGGRDDAFVRLAQSVPPSGPLSGVAVLETTGTPWAWAGTHLEYPGASADSLSVSGTPYQLVLETRRTAPSGRTAVGSVLLWADPIVHGAAASLAAEFARGTGAGLRFSLDTLAGGCPDPFDYEEPTTAGSRRLFTVCPLAPDQGAAKLAALTRARAVVGWALLAGLMLVLILAGSPTARLAVILGALWVAVRAPLADGMGLGRLFSPDTFFQTALGPLSGSPGALLLTGIAATVAGVALWRRRIPRTPLTWALAAVLLVGAPYLMSELARGITPPSGGVSIRLWLTWQLALVMASSAMIVLAAALLRGSHSAEVPHRLTVLGVVIALVAAAVGTVTWSPRPGWPVWYPFLWTPALILVTLPARRWVAIVGIALVAGSAAALVTWGAELRARLQVAQRDLGRLGGDGDALAEPLLLGMADAAGITRPENATALYALWRRSALGDEAYPVRLSLWTPAAELKSDLSLDALDLPTVVMEPLVRNFPAGAPPRVVRLLRIPGIHYVLLDRLDSATVLTIAVGPRSRLIAPSRLGDLLRAPSNASPLYEVTLAPPLAGLEADSTQLNWRRDGWSVRSERRIALPGGVRHVHAVVDMQDPFALLVRAALVVLLDAVALALVWLMAEWGSVGAWTPAGWAGLRRSFQFRTAFALALFFVVPAAGFSIWGMVQLGAEYRRAGDLLVRQGLRDAVVPVSALMGAPSGEVAAGLVDVGQRLDATLALYSGGRMLAASDAVLTDLGLIHPLADPAAFATIALRDEIEVTTGTPAGAPMLVTGYRVVQAGPPGGLGLLATLRRPGEVRLRDSQMDLGLALLLATLLGLAGAVAGAQLAARALGRPVGELGLIAAAIGRGRALPERRSVPPAEFEPVFGAIERMAADVRSSQDLLDQARRRTAAVLANVASGVIALDREGLVLMANPRAAQLLGAAPEQGRSLAIAADSPWYPVAEAALRFLAGPGSQGSAVEFEAAGRRCRLQLERLETAAGGVVLALDDVTDVARAERVLAWGEVARQVAHEVKNPLTPIRLGVQHLRRVYQKGEADFGSTLIETSDRILAEIDRLDTIARAFSRFAAPAADAPPLERLDLARAARDTASLYSMGGGAAITVSADGPAMVAARADEVKEVLVNLIENAREAGASSIRIGVEPKTLRVHDDGRGVPPALLPRIFEPRFSTNTSGSGLGLAIVQRLVTSWGARIFVASEPGQGTSVSIHW